MGDVSEAAAVSVRFHRRSDDGEPSDDEDADRVGVVLVAPHPVDTKCEHMQQRLWARCEEEKQYRSPHTLQEGYGGGGRIEGEGAGGVWRGGDIEGEGAGGVWRGGGRTEGEGNPE